MKNPATIRPTAAPARSSHFRQGCDASLSAAGVGGTPACRPGGGDTSACAGDEAGLSLTAVDTEGAGLVSVPASGCRSWKFAILMHLPFREGNRSLTPLTGFVSLIL